MAQTNASVQRAELLRLLGARELHPDKLTVYPEYGVALIMYRNVETGRLFRQHLLDSKLHNFSTLITGKGMCVILGDKHTKVVP